MTPESVKIVLPSVPHVTMMEVQMIQDVSAYLMTVPIVTLTQFVIRVTTAIILTLTVHAQNASTVAIFVQLN